MPYDSTNYLDAPVVEPQVTAADLLDRAADILSQPDSWVRGKARDDKGRVCALVAISEAAEAAQAPSEIVHGASQLADQFSGYGNIVFFNDSRATSAAEVVDVLRAAARYARANGE